MEVLDLVAYSYEQGKRVLEKREINTLKEHGQFLTPPSVAKYIAKQLGQIQGWRFICSKPPSALGFWSVR